MGTDRHRLNPLSHRVRRWLLRGEWAERLQLWAALFLQFAIAGVLVVSLWERQWLVAFTAGIVLALSFLPAIIERHWRVQLPVEFTFANCLFLYAAFGLGEAQQFYHRYWWWDLMLHSFAAVVMGLVGFLVVYAFYSTRRIRMAPIYVALVSFGLAVTIGTLWEIFEYLMDWVFGFNMQKSGLDDTMTDLMVDALGGLMAAAIGYKYVKGGPSLIADRIVRRFVATNPRLFNDR